jgi:hypothetical protein
MTEVRVGRSGDRTVEFNARARLMTLAIVTFGCLSARPPVAETTSQYAGTVAKTTYSHVYPPVGRWILLRRAGFVCAVRATRTYSTADGKRWSEGLFDWCYLATSNAGCQSGIRQGAATFGIEVVAPRLPVTSGNSAIGCPGLMVDWFPPTGVGFGGPGELNDDDAIARRGVEIALTGWCEVTRANTQDPRLRWLRYGDTAKPSQMDLGECW